MDTAWAMWTNATVVNTTCSYEECEIDDEGNEYNCEQYWSYTCYHAEWTVQFLANSTSEGTPPMLIYTSVRGEDYSMFRSSPFTSSLPFNLTLHLPFTLHLLILDEDITPAINDVSEHVVGKSYE